MGPFWSPQNSCVRICFQIFDISHGSDGVAVQKYAKNVFFVFFNHVLWVRVGF